MEYDTSMTLNENILVLEQNPNAKYLDPNYTNRGNTKAGSDYFAGMQMQQKQKISAIQFCLNPKTASKCKKLAETSNMSVFEMVVDNVTKDALLTAEIGKNLVVNLGKGDVRGAFRDLRDFFIETYSGAFVDIFVSVAGVEVGGPLVMEALEIAFMANDLFYFLENKSGNRDKSNYTSWEGIKWQFANNIDFQKLIVDLMVVATRGVMRSAGKAMEWLKKSGKTIATTILGYVSKIRGYLPKLGVIGKFLSDKLDKISSFLNNLSKAFTEKATQVTDKVKSKVGSKTAKEVEKKSATKFHRRITLGRAIKLFKNKKLASTFVRSLGKVPTKIPQATIAASFAALAQAGMMIGIEKLISSPETKTFVSTIENISPKLVDAEFDRQIRLYNPTLTKNVKKIEFAENSAVEIYLLDGKQYKFKNEFNPTLDVKDQFELIPYKKSMYDVINKTK